MINLFLGTIMSLSGVVLIGLVWAFICNERTYRQRMFMIDMRPSGTPEYWTISRQWWAVSYDRHLWSLFFFKDPLKLYGEETQKAYQEKLSA